MMTQAENSYEEKSWKLISNNFYLFVTKVFSKGFDNFQSGSYMKDVCEFLQSSKKTVRIAPKDHMKSNLLYAHIMWNIWKARYDRGFSAFYFSYDSSLAFYHLSNLKKLIDKNPFFDELTDYKISAEAVLKYAWEPGEYCTIKPKSMLSFKRGIHERMIYVDDPFQDPANRLDPIIVSKINEIFKTQIMDMPFQDGELHCVLTPQTKDDFCFDRDLMTRFKVLIQPAISAGSDGQPRALWPEHMPLEELEIRRKERGEKVFQQEYMCTPVYSSNCFWTREQLESMIDGSLPAMRELQTTNLVSLGWDIGKFRHPAHVAIFERVGNVWIQRYQEFMDGWDYTTQVDHVNSLIKRFSVKRGFYDATRGEVEIFREQKVLSPVLRPVIFSSEQKWKMATNMDRLRTQGRLKLLQDRRQTNQFLVVNDALQAVETHEGHGEPFWTAAMALMADIEANRGPPLRGSYVIPMRKFKPRSISEINRETAEQYRKLQERIRRQRIIGRNRF